MKLGNLLISFTAATMAAADGNPSRGGICNVLGANGGMVVCCNVKLPWIGAKHCSVLASGQSCKSEQTAYCCDTSATVSSLANA